MGRRQTPKSAAQRRGGRDGPQAWGGLFGDHRTFRHAAPIPSVGGRWTWTYAHVPPASSPIPAHGGTRNRIFHLGTKVTDYPRTRGKPFRDGAPPHTGAYPRTRGKHCLPLLRCLRSDRLSPHAGETHASRADVAVDCRLSPHAGETHWVSTTITAENLRLPPHAGETPKKGHATAIGPPLIPARGGNTWQKRAAYPPPSAYPRTRGKHIKKVEGGWLVDRLSPHAGETRSKFAIPERMAALIPARGGNTADHQSPPSRPPAYPRTRGKHP